MPKLIQGNCFNVSMYRSTDGVDLLSLQLRTDEGVVWKFNMGKAFDDIITDYKDIYHIMNAKTMTISTAQDSERKQLTFKNKITLV